MSKVRRMVAKQLVAMRRRWPAFQLHRRGRDLEWTGELQPFTWCRSHRVRVRYRPATSNRRGKVSVRVLHPKLDVPEHRNTVHLYADNSLCLFNPNRDEWNPAMLVADTIVPWVCEWIFFFESWLQTGSWLGGGDSHDSPSLKTS